MALTDIVWETPIFSLFLSRGDSGDVSDIDLTNQIVELSRGNNGILSDISSLTKDVELPGIDSIPKTFAYGG